jgi:hypothetical protein
MTAQIKFTHSARTNGARGVLWVGADQDGSVLDVIAAVEDEDLVIVHVMPHRWKEQR